jgi:DNA-binding response OmpR family regulator
VPEVLIVDDDPDIRGMLSLTLEDYGFSVREAPDGTAALQALAQRAPDCMVLDLMMPNLDGYGVLRAMRQQGLAARTRVVILTCKVEERDFIKGWELGADDYLTKPFDPDWLGRRLQELLTTTREALQARRAAEMQKAELLDRLESAFNRQRARASR